MRIVINRWPKSIEVLEFLYNNQDNFFLVQWNHEVWLLKHLKWEIPRYDDADYTKLRNYISNNPKILEFLENTPLYIEEETFRVVHAWVVPWISISKQTEKVLTEIYFYKELPWYSSYPKQEKLLFYWHWEEDWLHIRHNTIWLETGCSTWGKLTAYVLEDESVVQVSVIKTYCPPWDKWYEWELAKKWIFK